MRSKHFLLSLFFLFFTLSGNAQTMDVMTYNIRYDNPNDGINNWHKRKADVADLIRYYQPTVLGTQEGLVHQIKYLDTVLTDYQYVGAGRDDGKQKGEFCAIFYRKDLKLVDQGTFWLSETPDQPSVGWDAAMERICTYALLEAPAPLPRFWVFNVHFDHRGRKAREEAARLIAQTIAEKNQDLSLPVILMGDFNLTPETTPIQTLSATLTDTYTTERPYGPTGTFNGFDRNHALDARIDYIFVTGWEPIRQRHIDDRKKNGLYPSDHLPVLARLKALK
jgi:endonuclease/exonuclease/phosphatase family metal-dependent hydrolase